MGFRAQKTQLNDLQEFRPFSRTKVKINEISEFYDLFLFSISLFLTIFIPETFKIISH